MPIDLKTHAFETTYKRIDDQSRIAEVNQTTKKTVQDSTFHLSVSISEISGLNSHLVSKNEGSMERIENANADNRQVTYRFYSICSINFKPYGMSTATVRQ